MQKSLRYKIARCQHLSNKNGKFNKEGKYYKTILSGFSSRNDDFVRLILIFWGSTDIFFHTRFGMKILFDKRINQNYSYCSTVVSLVPNLLIHGKYSYTSFKKTKFTNFLLRVQETRTTLEKRSFLDVF